MKRNYKKKYLQKGMSRTIFIVGVAIAVVLVGAVLLGINGSNQVVPKGDQQNTNNPQSQYPLESNNPEDIVKTLYDKVESELYTFYYPRSYIRSDPEKNTLVKSYELAYENPNTKAVVPESVLLKILKNNQKLGLADFQRCNGFAESQRKSSNEKIEISIVTEEKFYGCKIKSSLPIDGVNDESVSVGSWLWLKDQGNDLSIYVVKVVYFANVSSDQTEYLNTAVDLFTLK